MLTLITNELEVGALLDNYGLRKLTWNTADQVISDAFVASPTDAEGRGIALEVRQGPQGET